MESAIARIDEELPPDRASAAYALLVKILSNIQRAPAGSAEAAKVRTLKKGGKALQETLGGSTACFEVLLLCGFEDVGENYTLPPQADMAPLASALELLEALSASVTPAAAPAAPAARTMQGGYIVGSAPAAATGGYADAKATPTQPNGFKRRGPDATQAAQEQLAAARAAQKAQYNGATPASDAAAPASGTLAAPTAAAKEETPTSGKQASAFDFKSRSKAEAEKKAAEDAANDLRAMQKQKFKDFKADPTAAKTEAYQRPPSTVNGTGEAGWFDWMWGGGSSSGGDSGGGGGPDRQGPRMKTIRDLPPPPRRG